MLRDFIKVGAIGASGTYIEAPGICNWNYLQNRHVSTCFWWIWLGQKNHLFMKSWDCIQQKMSALVSNLSVPVEIHTQNVSFLKCHLPPHARHNRQPRALLFTSVAPGRTLHSGFPSARRGRVCWALRHWHLLEVATTCPFSHPSSVWKPSCGLEVAQNMMGS